ncbi:unnamed protein product [Bursaphelenchus xylophilus]|uniref:(pine wood nematode) hypothetical protein n=1 Tax=Bursaphelenchus xylophilus TaxID=6326 RepID=A0A1I7S2X0_BURXY|nr:unnamed protein product [Bursaphelenchus xylophilus]CAG9116013.1 unnamed protein product [Bursaphelenchus xylophilus]
MASFAPTMTPMLSSVVLLSLLLTVNGREDVGIFYSVNPQIPPDDFQGEPHPGLRECNKHQLDYCQGQLAIHLGIDKALFKKPAELIKHIENLIFHDGTNGIFSLCKARTDFHTCLASNYIPCTDLFNILKFQGHSVRDSFILADLYDNMDFDCNGGFLQGIRHWDCIERMHTSDEYKQHTEQCFKQYNDTIHKNPQQYCQAAESFSFCQAIVFGGHEGCDAKELIWWECERTLRRSQLDGFCSKTTCSKVFTYDQSEAQSTPQKLTMFSENHKKYFKEVASKNRKLAASLN